MSTPNSKTHKAWAIKLNGDWSTLPLCGVYWFTSVTYPWSRGVSTALFNTREAARAARRERNISGRVVKVGVVIEELS